MAVIISNLRKEYPSRPNEFRVDSVSALGNPFRPSNGYTREKALELYEPWLREKLKNPTSPQSTTLACMIRNHRQHGEITLYCWCTPKPCHAEIIAEYVEILT